MTVGNQERTQVGKTKIEPMTGSSSQWTGERSQGESAIENLMRRITHKQSGRMGIQKQHVQRAIRTNAGKSQIGARRGDKIWAWVAAAVEAGSHGLKDTGQWNQEWMGSEERKVMVAKGNLIIDITLL